MPRKFKKSRKLKKYENFVKDPRCFSFKEAAEIKFMEICDLTSGLDHKNLDDDVIKDISRITKKYDSLFKRKNGKGLARKYVGFSGIFDRLQKTLLKEQEKLAKSFKEEPKESSGFTCSDNSVVEAPTIKQS